MIIYDICYAEQNYNAEFEDDGRLKNVWLDVRGQTGFKVDGIPVLLFLNKHAVESFESLWPAVKDDRVVLLAERHNDDSNDPPGAA